MISIQDIIQQIETFASPNLQENYDNVGLIVGNANQACTGLVLCIDAVEQIVEEAIENNCNLIIAHHPIIFSGLKKINGNNYIERTVIKAIKNNIAIYAAHTNFDNILNGVNYKIAEKLQLQNCEILLPKNTQNKNIGSGLIANLPNAIDEKEFLIFLKNKMNVSCIKHTKYLDKKIEKVAICGGSGSFLLQEAINNKADIFISADFKYHQFFDADNKILIADIGHYESEQFTTEIFAEIIQNKFPKFALQFTKYNTNPINYL